MNVAWSDLWPGKFWYRHFAEYSAKKKVYWNKCTCLYLGNNTDSIAILLEYLEKIFWQHTRLTFLLNSHSNIMFSSVSGSILIETSTFKLSIMRGSNMHNAWFLCPYINFPELWLLKHETHFLSLQT